MAHPSVGIDLGTTNSCLAVLQGDRPVIVPNRAGENITPSVVSINHDEVIVGQLARRRLLAHPAETFISIKRKMGQRWSRTIDGRDYTPESVSALILSHLKAAAEEWLGQPIVDAVITAPANFNSLQRQATKDAGEIAGLNVLRVINEPTAAALYYASRHQLSAIMVVFDLGGGTFDISVLEAADGLYEVIHSHGDNNLGGDDFNMRIADWIVRRFLERCGRDIRRDLDAMLLVQEWALAAKHSLTDSPEVHLFIPKLSGGADFEDVLTRVMYEELCRDLFDRIRSVAQAVQNELSKPKHREAYPGVFENGFAGCDILLVGGETRVPAVRQLVQNVFRGHVYRDTNPDEMVALGAAVQAGIIQRNGDIGEIVLVDTTALSLGTAVKGELFSRIIDANTTIPATRTQEYTPMEDNQRSVLFKIYQGESELVEHNVKLGEFEFLLQPPRPRHDAVLELTFHLDANDILFVSAKDKKTGAKQDLMIKGSQNLSRSEVEKLKMQARENLAQDRAKAERIRRHVQLGEFAQHALTRAAELQGRDPADPLAREAADRASVLQRALAGGDDQTIEAAARELESVWGTVLGAATPAGQAAAPAATGAPAARDETVVCPNCGARIIHGYAFCGKCGVPLKKDKCSTCGEPLPEGFAFCGKCGTKVN